DATTGRATTADQVDLAAQHRDAATGVRGGRRRAGGPGVGRRIVDFQGGDGVSVRAPATDHVDLAVDGRDRRLLPRRADVRGRRPRLGGRIVDVVLGQQGNPVDTGERVDLAVHRGHAVVHDRA